ncbi:hypothetical protein BurJ1DRAFT_3148 [Burkholderiales bacterium JOSHI_001]|nr:hypothetical protein BurJ1DRAFT_3148 [Burkholderiales bacterium JOSHI_001]
MLAQLLRAARVVLLLGEAQSDRRALIHDELAPLLARRWSDRIDASDSGPREAAEHAPERRRRTDRNQECVVIFDRWTSGVGGPLQHLRHSLAAKLGVGTAELEAAPKRLDEALAAWTQARPVHVLLLLHHFEDHLLAARPGPEHAHVTDELVRLLNRPGLPVSVLLSLTEAAQPHLAGMRSLVPGLEDMSLRLKAGGATAPGRDAFTLPMPDAPAASMPGHSNETPGPATTRQHGPERSDPKRGPVDRPAIRSDDVYALINSTLTRVATGSAANPLMEGRPASSEPEIETFQPGPQPRAVGRDESLDAFLPDRHETSPPPEAHPAGQAAPARMGWWTRLMRLLGRGS